MTDTARDSLSLRIRAALPAIRIREVRMFGANCFMVDGAMAVAAHKDGSLLVHIDRDTDPVYLENPHATRAEMGTGRSMGPGWIRIDPAGLVDDEALAHWISAALQRPPHTDRTAAPPPRTRPGSAPTPPRAADQNPRPQSTRPNQLSAERRF